MAEVMLGKPVADAITAKLVSRVEVLAAAGVTPTLAIVRVGERADDLSYERGAEKRCAAVGIAVRRLLLDESCSQEELLSAIELVNADDSIHGCLMFRPLPKTLDEAAACEAVAPEKDVDGITTSSMAGVFAGRPLGFPPCTAQAVLETLDFYGVALDGADVCVVGRSLVIGRPVALMLQARNATVTMCHTHTRDLAAACSGADVIVAAAGHACTIGAGHVREGQVVVDVGINWDEVAGRLVGDVDFDAVADVAAAVTPVPRGIGSVTTAVLAKHVVTAAERSLT